MLLFMITGVIAVMVFFKDAYHYGIYNTYLCVRIYIHVSHYNVCTEQKQYFALL